ncbi:Uncharacterised protein [Campylobacter hyointestinalis subsp. hyointestinalis]|uniref:Uncharacterized protein n=1 Tax=Campylobacter hyointestinalis subsp. hyointestinalis TaxID=91352 RepID=A0A9W5AS22_CAMHY|nr:hypothetical protein [Campylobacter hyointestinalis]CUU79185.1 Uncharacterised protein [Campylobacter hyointestinalis subsp. hyointestinalis]CUU83282.1 Uncharacterised protein [Campylobacter hyointestinalis subsp. hyointestinalis]CUU88635.1 Uncharacterised protein [Campylobacter hyointestinalis subsp. hyointestinalis]
MNEIEKFKHKELIDPQAQMVVSFLEQMGLPYENIIADQSQRQIIGQNLFSMINSLELENKKDARYLSKFVVGAGFGLFDYSINAIWNEVTLNLRKKAITYGLDIFYDAAVGGKARELYKSEQDLSSLKEAVLLDTCRKLELISDTTYKKLKHMLDMRNDIGISHPTNYSINAFELLGWLQNAITDVLNDKPTESALQVQAFIQNLKTQTTLIDASTKQTIESKIIELATHHLSHIMRTIFGIFVTEDTDPVVRKNISLIAPAIWENCNNEVKYKLGMLLEGYNTNLYQNKYKLGEEFFKIVNGNSFRTENERTIILDNLLTELLEKHNGWDNYQNEAIVVDSISSYIQEYSDILPNNVNKLVKVIFMCRIGKGVEYCQGVSPKGKLYYDNILNMLGDTHIPHLIASLTHYEIQRKLEKNICRKHAKDILVNIKSTIINERLIECLDYLIAKIDTNGKCVFETEFKKLSSSYIQWDKN